ncbi:small nuclear ribonucleoprotein [Cardiosporidium cionae]|uniref:Small nuclear ribonucleoprotein n=1 Tax=Cardiosporidium cionae TaxID=476202 RepID=A0ABQ7J9A5_9APIC|nr:small nuclear ribonucleoprotein [Cardiosporidium cionae]|eukprot:KAF8820596.1 small nuclear ribonucleoprotein [Cardiosporidium cionae]
MITRGRPQPPAVPSIAAGLGDIPPNQTLYCKNLNDKIKRQEMISCLYEFFCSFGEIVDIVCRNGASQRGQAFVVFNDISSATNALRSMQGKEFLDKPMNIQYAKRKSDAIARLDGSYKPRWINGARAVEGQEATSAEGQKMRPFIGAKNLANQATLFVENVPPTMTIAGLEALFKQYPGIIECRLVEGRNVAFVDFRSSTHAEVAMDGLQDFRVTPDYKLKISFLR